MVGWVGEWMEGWIYGGWIDGWVESGAGEGVLCAERWVPGGEQGEQPGRGPSRLRPVQLHVWQAEGFGSDLPGSQN